MDTWYFSRENLADKYLKIFNVGITSNLAIIAPRRKGKTLFILNDVSGLAKKENTCRFMQVYGKTLTRHMKD